MIDAHCHLEHMDAEGVVKEAKGKMTAIVTSIADIKDKGFALDIKKKHPNFVFICLGFHPEAMNSYTDDDINSYLDFIRQNKQNISAVGETGLDYNWNTKMDDQEKSKKLFRKFIDLAKELDMPLVIHSRNGKGNQKGSDGGIGDAIKMLEDSGCRDVMMHCFSGSEGQLKRCLANGWMISYATLVVKSFKHQGLAKQTPLDQIVLETDSPWLDPDSQPGSKELTNRPWKIEQSAEIIAQLMGTTKEEIIEKTTENAKRFFRIG